MDYAFAVARKYLPYIHDMIEALPVTEMGPMGKRMNAPYTPQTWEEFRTRYNFHKLTRKISLDRTDANGRLTNYGHLLDIYGM